MSEKNNSVLFRGVLIALIVSAVVAAGSVAIGLGVKYFSSNFSVILSHNDYALEVTEDSYSNLFDYKSEYSFEIKHNGEVGDNENYSISVFYNLDNQITINGTSGNYELNDVFNIETPITNLFNVSQSANVFKINFENTLDEIVTDSLNDEVEIIDGYDNDPFYIEITYKDSSIKIYGSINYWSLSLDYANIIF